MIRNLKPILLSLALGGILGFLLARWRTPDTRTRFHGAGGPTVSTRFTSADSASRNPSARLPDAHLEAADIEAWLRKTLTEPSARRWRTLQELIRVVSPTDVPAALTLGDRVLPANLRDRFRTELFERWAEADPQAVLAYAMTLKSRNERTQAEATAIREWARNNAAAALGWARQQPRGQVQQQLLSRALEGLAETDPKAAQAIIDTLPPALRRQVQMGVITALAERDPRAAAELAMKQMPNNDRFGWGDNTLSEVLQTWIGQDPAGTVAWLRAQRRIYAAETPLARPSRARVEVTTGPPCNS